MFFLEFPSFLYDPANVGNLISGSFPFSKPSLDISKFLVCIMLKPSMQEFKHDLISREMNAIVQWLEHSLSTTLLRNWDENWSSPVATAGSFRFADILTATPWWHRPLRFWIVLINFMVPKIIRRKETVHSFSLRNVRFISLLINFHRTLSVLKDTVKH